MNGWALTGIGYRATWGLHRPSAAPGVLIVVASGDFFDRGADRARLGRGGDDDAVAVEHGLGERLGHRDRVVDGDRGRVGFLPRSASMRLAAASTLVSAIASSATFIAAVSISLGFLNTRLMSSTAARMSCTRIRPSLVHVHELERRRIDIDTGRRHRERHPQLLIEVGKREEVVSVAQRDLVDRARTKEMPPVKHRAHPSRARPAGHCLGSARFARSAIRARVC